MPALAQSSLQQELQATKPNLLPESSILPDVKMMKRTHPEKIVFTQVKLAGDRADIDSFAKASPRVAKAQDIDKTAMALAEYNRIGNAYNMHDEKGMVVVHTQLRADEYSSLQDMIVFDEFDETSFFQFQYYGYNVGIVPEDIQKFSNLALSKTSAERFFRILNSDKDITAEFILIPSYSDTQQPLMMNEKMLWLMSARVGEFRLWSNEADPQLLWFHRAPWYSPKSDTDIGNLYTKPQS